MTGTEIYKRTAAYEREAREIKLLAPQWKLLLAFDGVRTLSEAAMGAETSFAEAIPLTQKFLDSNWIEECPITLDQYMKRVGAKDISTTGATVAPAVVVHQPKKDSPTVLATPAPTPVPVTPSAVSRPVTAPLPPLVKPSAVVTPSAPPPLPVTPPTIKSPESPLAATPKPATPKASRSSMKLGAVVDYITSLVGNISLGQLLVYRVFLRVPPELLMAEDIASVHLANDTSLITSEKLQKAIAEAVNAVTKRTLPDSVFAAA